MKFHPCIDIHGGKVKQIVGSTLSGKETDLVTNFQTDLSPAYYAEIYKNDKLTDGHVIMLGEGNENAAIQALNAYPGGLQVGGGINPQNAFIFLDAGASHVIVTSYVFSGGNVQWKGLHIFLKLWVKVNWCWISVAKRRAIFCCNQSVADVYRVNNFFGYFRALAKYCDQFLIHAADVEGKRGYR